MSTDQDSNYHDDTTLMIYLEGKSHHSRVL
jgi:hypothetical protein